MATGIEPITLPWKRPEKGVSAAELGASFRIEQRENGWHCTVQVGRRSEVLVTGMRRLRDAQCRAEAHAATMPEVARAVEQRAAEAAKPVQASPPAAQVDTPGPVTAPSVAKRKRPTFQQVSDGCICGKIEGGTWIADPAGKVSVPAGTDPALAQEICRVATAHYTAQRAKAMPAAPPPSAKTVSRASARSTAKAAAKPVSKVATSKAAASKSASKAAASKATASKATASKATASKAATSKATVSKAGTAKAGTAKAAAKSTSRAAATKAAPETPAAKPARRAGRGKRRGKAASKKAVGEPRRRGPKFVPQAFRGTNAPPGASREALEALRTMQEAPTTKGKAGKTTQKEGPVGKRSSKGKDGACGCVTWTEAEGKARGEAKHGAYVIEPEGKKHALYFYDPEGQSRHVQSGDAAKLRSVAEEMAARGQPAPRSASAGDDAALLKMFMAGAMEEEG